MSSRARCPICHHLRAIHSKSGICPPWAATGVTHGSLRVVIRIADKWPECENCVLIYMPECVNADRGMILMWNLTTDEQLEVPTFTARAPWTRKPTNEEREKAIEDLRMMTGEHAITTLRQLV
jgi:hypothetical protein